jgi:hypothetical protein
MPTVPPQTEADHYFRAVQSVIFAIVGTLLVLFSVPAIRPNWMGIFFAALCSVSVIIPAALAMRTASRNLPTEIPLAHKRLERNLSLNNSIFGILLIASAWYFPNHGQPRMTIPAVAAVLAIYMLATAWLVEFKTFAFVGIALFVAAMVPWATMATASAPPVAGLLAGLMLWVASFLVFSRTSQQ